MSDFKINENRPNAAEEARAQDRKKISTQKNPGLGNQSAQSARDKMVKSAFDHALENAFQANKAPTESSKFDAKLEGFKENRDNESGKDKKDDSSNTSSDNKLTRSSSEPKATPQKILSKNDTSKHSSDSETGGGSSEKDSRGSGFGQKQTGRVNLQPNVGLETGLTGISGIQKKAMPLDSKLAEKTALVGKVPREVFDQIVSFVNVGINEKRNQEIRIDLGNQMFKGLSLKVGLTKSGAVEISFLSQSPEVRSLFEASKKEIGAALAEKGIRVSELRVQDSRPSSIGRMV